MNVAGAEMQVRHNAGLGNTCGVFDSEIIEMLEAGAVVDE
jgi:hypothetical protein